MSQEFLQLCKENKLNLLKLDGDQKNFKFKNELSISKLKKEFDDKVDSLKKELRSKEEVIENKIEEKKETFEEEKKNLLTPLEKAERIKKLLEINNSIKNDSNDLFIEDKNITNRNGKIEPLGVIFQDEFMQLKAFLVENGSSKKVNRFCIEVYGNSHFINMFLNKYGTNPLHDYCLESSIKGYAPIKKKIKDFKTIEDARNYFEKNKEKILKSFIEDHKKLKIDFYEVIKEYNINDFSFLDGPLKVSNEEAPAVFEYGKEEVRLFNGFYWKKANKKEKLRECIEIGRKIYEKWCAKEELCITQCGNISFGSWWSVDVEPSHPGKSCVPFSKENFERVLNEAVKFCKERTKGRVKPSYPKIKYLNLP